MLSKVGLMVIEQQKNKTQYIMTNNTFHADGFNDLKQILKSDLNQNQKELKNDKIALKKAITTYKEKIKSLGKSVF